MSMVTESDLNNTISSHSNIYFVDSNIDDYQSIISNLDNAELIVLDSTRNGVEQVTETLTHYSEVAGIHIISHGQAGTLQLGATDLNADNLDSYATSIRSWSDSLTDSGDILLYGCTIGAGAIGDDFITSLSQLTNADIAASDDLTGSRNLGGDWDLEITTGEIEASIIDVKFVKTYGSILAIGNSSQETIIDFDDFGDASQLKLNGNATQVNDTLRLTPDRKTQKGTAFFEQALAVTADTSFSTQFQFQVTGGTTGADGFTFMLQNDSRGLNALGGQGGGLGYRNVNQSLAIEFDTYFNPEFDPNNNHISVLQNGDIRNSLAVATAPFDLNNGGLLNAWIDYDGQNDLLEVYLADSLNKPNASLLSTEVDLTAVVGDRAFLGFSAATGGRSNNHDILDWEVMTNSSFLSASDDEPELETIVDLDNFADTSLLTLKGDTTQTNNVLRLTSAAKAQKGSAFFSQALAIDSDTSFATQFQFQITGGTTGADGFTFMLQNDSRGLNTLGGNGGSLGYNGVAQSLAIEFDTYFNSQFDPNDNHISVLQNGNVRAALTTITAPYDLNSGDALNAWVDYNGDRNLLEVYLSDTLNKPSASLLSLDVDLASVVGERAFLGFSAATGGRFNNHDILDWEVASNSSLLPLTNEAGLNSIIDLENFADISKLKLNGNASQVNNILRLTPNKVKQKGSVFLDEPIRVNDQTSFSTKFQFQIGGGTNGADGFAFILQNDRLGDNALGVDSGGVGYRGIGKSIAIEFDTYKGSEDPNNNHISVLRNGDTNNAVVNANSPFDLNSGEILNAWIDYDGSSDRLLVFLSDTTIKPQTAILSTTVDLAATVGDRARVGFSAGTGGLGNTHDLLNWSFESSDKFAPEGNFSNSISWPSVAIHAGLTPDGKVLTYGLDANFRVVGSQVNTKFAIWDPKQGTNNSAFRVLNMSHPVDNAFCSGMILLPDGQMLIAGGSIQGKRDAGNDLVHLYDYRTGKVAMLPEGSDLLAARWYPTMTTLTDGRILVQGGRDAGQTSGVFTPEIYTAGQGSSWLNGATSSTIYSNAGNQWWYPRSWVAPNGQVFGITNDDMYYLDPNGDGSITPVGIFSGTNRGITSTAVMYDRGKILQVGGNNNQATIIDINNGTPVLSSAGTANYRRMWGDSTVLPDGTVFVSGGSIKNNVAEQVAYAAEIWNPQTNTWTVVDSAAALRLYHSTSLLLPDGTVLTAGGTTPGFDTEALSSEIYRPAYLYDDQGNPAQRPTIASEDNVINWETSMTATVGAGQQIDRISLVSFGAVTHSFDMGQRFLELDFTQSGDRLTIETPESANVAPPGYYMLFAMNKQGVPSEAKIVQIR